MKEMKWIDDTGGPFLLIGERVNTVIHNPVLHHSGKSVLPPQTYDKFNMFSCVLYSARLSTPTDIKIAFKMFLNVPVMTNVLEKGLCSTLTNVTIQVTQLLTQLESRIC